MKLKSTFEYDAYGEKVRPQFLPSAKVAQGRLYHVVSVIGAIRERRKRRR